MSLEELLGVVRPFSLVSPDMLLDAIHDKTTTRTTDLRHRGLLGQQTHDNYTIHIYYTRCIYL